MPINEVVVVNITRETQSVTQKGFGTPLILGNHTKWNGTKQVHTLVFSASLVSLNEINGKVDGVSIATTTFTTDNATTLAALATTLQAHAKILTAVSNGTNTITVTTEPYQEIVLSNFIVTLGASQPTISVTETVEQKDEIRSYSTIEAVAEDFSTSDVEYKKALALFSQDLSPEVIKIGRRRTPVTQVVEVSVITVADDTDYTVTLNGTEFTYTSQIGDVAADIVDGLIAAIDAGDEPVSTTDNGDTFTLTADVPGESFDIEVTINLSFTTTTANQGMAGDILKAEQVDNDWYYLIITTSLVLDIKEASKTIEAMNKLFFYKTSDADVKNNVSGNIGEFIKNKGYDRTVQFYIGDSASHPDAAWIGGQAPKDPGSITWKFKPLNGVTVDNLTTTEKNNLIANNVNYYTAIGGVNIAREGYVASGEWIDIMNGTDWIQARIEENVYSALVNSDKIPYTNAGIDVVKSKVKQILLQAVGRSILVDEPDRPLSVTAPDILDIPTNDKTQRILRDVKFSGYYAGAIHKVYIQGKLSI